MKSGLVDQKVNAMYSRFQIRIFSEKCTLEPTREWRADSTVARSKDSEKSITQADSKKGEPTWAKYDSGIDHPEPTQMEKSQLKQCQHFW